VASPPRSPQSEDFTSAIESQAAAAPRGISDPKSGPIWIRCGKVSNRSSGVKSRGKDIYKLPWYVIIGESGSGKTEAIRHSEIDSLPPEQGASGLGGTVNMDWWFTIAVSSWILPVRCCFPKPAPVITTAMAGVFAPCSKGAPDCPVNGLFLVLSIESIIKDSADRISQKPAGSRSNLI